MHHLLLLDLYQTKKRMDYLYPYQDPTIPNRFPHQELILLRQLLREYHWLYFPKRDDWDKPRNPHQFPHQQLTLLCQLLRKYHWLYFPLLFMFHSINLQYGKKRNLSCFDLILPKLTKPPPQNFLLLHRQDLGLVLRLELLELKHSQHHLQRILRRHIFILQQRGGHLLLHLQIEQIYLILKKVFPQLNQFNPAFIQTYSFLIDFSRMQRQYLSVRLELKISS